MSHTPILLYYALFESLKGRGRQILGWEIYKKNWWQNKNGWFIDEKIVYGFIVKDIVFFYP